MKRKSGRNEDCRREKEKKGLITRERRRKKDWRKEKNKEKTNYKTKEEKVKEKRKITRARRGRDR